MGTLFYGTRIQLAVEDRLLAHVKVLATSKLRRSEGFLLSWSETPATGSGRGSLWIHPAADLFWWFDGGKAPSLDRDLLEQMALDSVGSTGLHIEASIRAMPGR